MNISYRLTPFLVVFGALTFGPLEEIAAAADDLQVVYVPVVYALVDDMPLPGGGLDRTVWLSSLTLFNNSDSPATFNQVALYGGGGFLHQYPHCISTGTLEPHSGANIGGCTGPFPDRGVGFLALETSPGAVVRSDVMRAKSRCCGPTSSCTFVSQGQVATPAYRSLFPAGSTAVSGAVELGDLPVPYGYNCPYQQYGRRVNVTLFNAGDASALFTITVLPVRYSPLPLSQQDVVVPAKDVIQVNRLPVPMEESGDLGAVGGYRVWITITADQPFLSYVSTVLENPQPGPNPSTSIRRICRTESCGSSSHYFAAGAGEGDGGTGFGRSSLGRFL